MSKHTFASVVVGFDSLPFSPSVGIWVVSVGHRSLRIRDAFGSAFKTLDHGRREVRVIYDWQGHVSGLGLSVT